MSNFFIPKCWFREKQQQVHKNPRGKELNQFSTYKFVKLIAILYTCFFFWFLDAKHYLIIWVIWSYLKCLFFWNSFLNYFCLNWTEIFWLQIKVKIKVMIDPSKSGTLSVALMVMINLRQHIFFQFFIFQKYGFMVWIKSP